MKLRKQNGVTLIALVVTIVVLLILAGVSINLVVGDNGIIKKAQDARDKHELGANKEQDDMKNLEEVIDVEVDKKPQPQKPTRPEPNDKLPILDKQLFQEKCNKLTGAINFSLDKAPSTATINLNNDGTVKCEIKDNNAYIYGINGNGVSAPKESNSLFSNFYNVKKIDFIGLYTNNVTNLNGAFATVGAALEKGLEYLDLSYFDTSKVTSMIQMFSSAKIQNIEWGDFDTRNVTKMNGMFWNADIPNLDLRSFETENVTSMDSMFSDCKFKTTNLSSFDTRKVTNFMDMFKNTPYIEELDLRNFETPSLNIMTFMFYNCMAKKIILSKLNTTNVNSFSFVFYGAKNIQELDLSSFNTKNVRDLNNMFWGCTNLKRVNLSSFDTSNVMSMNSTFVLTPSLEELDLSSFNTSNCTDFYMFLENSKVKKLNVSSFTFNSNANIGRMFDRFETDVIDLSNCDVNYDVNNMRDFFFSAKVNKVYVKKAEYIPIYKEAGGYGLVYEVKNTQ